MQVTFTPEVCKPKTVMGFDGQYVVNESLYDGTVTFRPLNFEERIDVIERLDEEFGEDDESKTEAEKKKENMKRMRRLASIAKERIVSIDMVRKEDGFKITDWDHLSYDSDLNGVINEISLKLVGKFKVGDPLLPR